MVDFVADTISAACRATNCLACVGYMPAAGAGVAYKIATGMGVGGASVVGSRSKDLVTAVISVACRVWVAAYSARVSGGMAIGTSAGRANAARGGRKNLFMATACLAWRAATVVCLVETTHGMVVGASAGRASATKMTKSPCDPPARADTINQRMDAVDEVSIHAPFGPVPSVPPTSPRLSSEVL